MRFLITFMWLYTCTLGYVPFSTFFELIGSLLIANFCTFHCLNKSSLRTYQILKNYQSSMKTPAPWKITRALRKLPHHEKTPMVQNLRQQIQIFNGTEFATPLWNLPRADTLCLAKWRYDGAMARKWTDDVNSARVKIVWDRLYRSTCWILFYVCFSYFVFVWMRNLR